MRCSNKRFSFRVHDLFNGSFLAVFDHLAEISDFIRVEDGEEERVSVVGHTPVAFGSAWLGTKSRQSCHRALVRWHAH